MFLRKQYERMVFIKRLVCFLLLVLISFSACQKQEDLPVMATLPEDFLIMPKPSPTPSPTPLLTPVTEPELDLTGLAVNNLTGCYIGEEVAGRRPVAVVINNLRKALPQSGIAQADLYYEVLAEGDITRIVAIFKEFDSQKIGPVRSTRDYFLDFALDNDAVFVHHGGSPGGYSFISSNRINNIDGMRDGQAYWRDPVRVAIQGMYEHSSYTNAEKIMEEIGRKGYRTELKEGYQLFDFYDEVSYPGGGTLTNKVTVPFSNSQCPVFVYDYKNNVFKRSQADGSHIDEETGEQLEVTNVIVQQASMKIVDSEGRRQVKLVADGKGYLITGGQYSAISWKKESHESPTEYFDESGNKLKLNKGKTWICVLQDNAEVIFE